MGSISKSRALSADEIKSFGEELDSLRKATLATVGKRESDYIYQVRDIVRYTEIVGRSALMLGWLPPLWLAGASLLGVSKIIENMELGHNVIHGQYDWMNDPSLRGSNYEWDHASSSAAWRHSHNYLHHTYTNVVGRDRDIGYTVLRLTDEQAWKPYHLIQPISAAALAFNFQWGISLYDLELDRVADGKKSLAQLAGDLKPFASKIVRQVAKDYVFFPLLAGPSFLPVLTGNIAANTIRDIWTFGIIFCGHFTADAEMFDDNIENETRGEWYLRQLRGSSNLTGSKTFEFMTGHLSRQIEHHMFPDVPALRYPEMAVKVQEICARYGQHYNTGPFTKQFASVVKRIFKYSLPTRRKVAAMAETAVVETTVVEATIAETAIAETVGIAQMAPSERNPAANRFAA